MGKGTSIIHTGKPPVAAGREREKKVWGIIKGWIFLKEFVPRATKIKQISPERPKVMAMV